MVFEGSPMSASGYSRVCGDCTDFCSWMPGESNEYYVNSYITTCFDKENFVKQQVMSISISSLFSSQKMLFQVEGGQGRDEKGGEEKIEEEQQQQEEVEQQQQQQQLEQQQQQLGRQQLQEEQEQQQQLEQQEQQQLGVEEGEYEEEGGGIDDPTVADMSGAEGGASEARDVENVQILEEGEGEGLEGGGDELETVERWGGGGEENPVAAGAVEYGDYLKRRRKKRKRKRDILVEQYAE